MADKKISQLTAASTPVAGTEVFPAVQSGSTVKVSIDDLFNRQANYLPVYGADRATTTYGNLHVASTSNAAAYNGGTLSFGGKSVATGNQYVFGGFKFMSDPASGTGWDTYATMSLTNADSSVSEKFSFKNNGNLTALSGNFVLGTNGKGIVTNTAGQITQDAFSGFTSGVAKVISPTKSSGFMVFVTGYSLSGGYSAILNYGDTITVVNEQNTTGGTIAFTSVSNQLNVTTTGSAAQILQELWVSVIGK